LLGAVVGRKRGWFSDDSRGVDAGLEVGLTGLAEAAPVPVAVISAVAVGAGLLGFLAWKGFAHLSGKKFRR
jgi:hypothetical protein